MSAWRNKRQMSYMLLVVIFFLTIGGIYYYFSIPEPTCFDNKKNQDELGVDCGGSCERICTSDALPLKVLWLRPLTVVSGTYSVVGLIENQNPNLGVEELKYTVKLLDTSGQVVAERSGQTFSLPQNRFAIFESNILANNVTRAFIEFNDPFWEEVNKELPLLRLSQSSYSDSPTPRLTAVITNETVEDLYNIQVVAVLSDEGGNTYAASATMVDELLRFSSRPIFFTWPKSFGQEPVFIDLYPKVFGSEF